MTVSRPGWIPAAVLAFGGWVAAALVNAGEIALGPGSHGGGGARALHVAVDAGQTIAIGAAAALVTGLWVRFGPARPLWTRLGVLLSALLLAEWVLPDDLDGAVERWGDTLGAGVTLHLSLAALALAPAACLLGGRRVAGRFSTYLGPLGAFALFVGNSWVLENGYHGAHAWIAFSAATLFSACFATAPVEDWLAARLPPRRALVAASAVLALAALSTIPLPPERARLALLERDTAFLAPWLSSLHGSRKSGSVPIPAGLARWYASRAHRAAVPSSAQGFAPPSPIVILITIDALRQEVLGPNASRIAPNLDEMRQRSVYFSQARSFGSDTRFSLAALFSGRHLSMLRWNFARSRSRPTLETDKLPRLPELLNAEDIPTVTGVSLPHMLVPRFGIVRGFREQFVKEDTPGRPGTVQVIDRAIERLKAQGAGPLFYYAHLLDPHQPYKKHDGHRAEGEERSPHDDYLGEVTFADAQVGRLRRAVRELGLTERCVFIVSSDHGEAFGEHGLRYHNKPLYEVMVHVPLLIELPRVPPRVIDAHVSLSDVGATVLDLLGVPKPGYWMSESLVPLLRGERGDPERPIYMERLSEQALLFGDGIKVLLREKPRSEEIYDLVRDPAERDNLRESLGVEGDRRVALTQAYAAAHATTEFP